MPQAPWTDDAATEVGEVNRTQCQHPEQDRFIRFSMMRDTGESVEYHRCGVCDSVWTEYPTDDDTL